MASFFIVKIKLFLGDSFRSGTQSCLVCYAAEHLMVWLLCRMLISHLYG